MSNSIKLQFEMPSIEAINKSADSIVNRLGTIDKDIQKWILFVLPHAEINRNVSVINNLFLKLHKKFGNRAPVRVNAIHEMVQAYGNVKLVDIHKETGKIYHRVANKKTGKMELPKGIKESDVIKGYEMRKIRVEYTGRLPVVDAENKTEWQNVTFKEYSEFYDRVCEIDWKQFQPEKPVQDFNVSARVASIITAAVKAGKYEELVAEFAKQEAKIAAEREQAEPAKENAGKVGE